MLQTFSKEYILKGRRNKFLKTQFSLKRIEKLKASKIFFFSSIILSIYVLGIFIRIVDII